MNIREPRAPGSTERVVARLVRVLTWTAAVIGIAAELLFVAVLFTAVFRPGGASIAATGVYAATSALLAAVALGVMSASLIVQRTNLRREELRESDRVLADLRNQMMAQPELGQCWGPRISPPHVPEYLFLYTASIIDYWSRQWRAGQIGEVKARQLAREFFKSEVPRMYWERFGSWPRRKRARALMAILDDEFLSAIHEGPPLRPYEPYPPLHAEPDPPPAPRNAADDRPAEPSG